MKLNSYIDFKPLNQSVSFCYNEPISPMYRGTYRISVKNVTPLIISVNLRALDMNNFGNHCAKG